MTLKNLWDNSRIRTWTVIILCLAALAAAVWFTGSGDFRFQNHSRVRGFSASKEGGALITLTWDAHEWADGYELFRYSKGEKKYILLRDIHSPSVTSYRDEEVNAHFRQKYKIRAYRLQGGSRKTGESVLLEAGGLNGYESIGHRGAMEYAPDDTIVSFAKAKSLGYKTFECDAWNTQSGEMYIFHDPVMDILTDGSGSPAKLSRDNYLSFPIVHGKNADHYEIQYPPDLEQVVRWAGEHDMNLLLHLKSTGLSHNYMCYRRMEQILEKYHMIERTVLFTSNIRALTKMSHFSFRTAFLTASHTSAGRCLAANMAAKNGCELVIMKYLDTYPITAEVINYSHERGIRVSCYNIDRHDQVSRLISIRMDQWITNRVLFKRNPN